MKKEENRMEKFAIQREETKPAPKSKKFPCKFCEGPTRVLTTFGPRKSDELDGGTILRRRRKCEKCYRTFMSDEGCTQ